MAGRTSVDDTAGPPAGARGLPGPIEPNGDTATTPARFSGRVFVGGRPAAEGTVVSALVGGAVCGQAKATVDGPAAYYLLDVASAATRAGCGTDGAEIDFSVGDATAKERAVFRGGSTSQLDLHVEMGGVDTAASAEVALHEVGASVAATIAGVQQELARYPIALGAFVLDELALTVPVRLRVDALGQVMATVVEDAATGTDVTQLQLRFRPVLDAPPLPAPAADQPLDVLGALTPQAIATLESYRVYSVGDLLRVGGSIAGRAALTRLGLGVEPSALLERAALLAMPVLPSAVSVALVKIGIASPAQFVATEPGTLVEPLNTLLAGRLERPIAVADVAAWQARVRRAIAVPLPDTTSR